MNSPMPHPMRRGPWMKWARVMLGILVVILGLPLLFGAEAPAAAGAGEPGNDALRTVGIAAAASLAIALSVIGAGYAVGRIGSAAMGAAAEKPELLVRSLLFVALAEGLAVLGFAIAMVLVQKI